MMTTLEKTDRVLSHTGQTTNNRKTGRAFRIIAFSGWLLAAGLAGSQANASILTFTDRASWQNAVNNLGMTTFTDDLENQSQMTAVDETGGIVGPPLTSAFLNFAGEQIDTPLLNVFLEFAGPNTGNYSYNGPGNVDGSNQLTGGGTGAGASRLRYTANIGNVAAFGIDYNSETAGRFRSYVELAGGGTSSTVNTVVGPGFMGFISDSNQALATVQSLATVARETPRTSAVSSLVSPAKKRSSTTRRLRSSRDDRRSRASLRSIKSTAPSCAT